MTLATASPGASPSARIVLLKGFDARGFVFFTNYESAKGQRARRQPARVPAVLLGRARTPGPHHRQRDARVRAKSRPHTSTRARSRARSARGRRPRAECYPIERRWKNGTRSCCERHRGHEVPLPPFWGGYRVRPERIEFWQGRQSRLHDRLLYTRQADGTWSRVRLAP